MARRKPAKDPTVAKLDDLIVAVQDLFILQALTAGMKSHPIRAILKVDIGRINKISKPLKQAQRASRT